MWAIADDIAFGTQDSILQWDCIDDRATSPMTYSTRLHHRTSRLE